MGKWKRIMAASILAGLCCFPVGAAEITLRNSFAFFSDNTEFFEPFRLRETILGEQFKSFLELPAGDRTVLWAGLWADHRDGLNSETSVQPIFSFVYQSGDLKNVMGAFFPELRHGLIEPMEVTALELTRPVEYGTQLLLENSLVQADLFINWQYLLTASSREIFDYGGSARFHCFPGVDLEGQAHCYHVGGVSYGGVVRNNYTGGLGLFLESPLPVLGKSSLQAFYLGSNDTDRPGYPGPAQGCGFYAKGTVSPFRNWEAFGIAWVGRDYMSEEGDGNYNSFGYDGVYYKSDRNYEEAGIRYSAAIDGGVTFDFEIRSHWIEDAWAHSFRVVAQAPFDVVFDVRQKETQSQHEVTKTQRTDQDVETSR